MAKFETSVAAGREAERFDTAFYRFLEREAPRGSDDIAFLRTEPHGVHDLKIVHLWSEEAARDFANFWRDFRPVKRPG